MSTRFTFSARLLLCAAALAGCTDAPTAAPTQDAAATDVVLTDAAVADTPAGDVGSPGGACSFNDDCVPSERCVCDEVTGCACAPGARGTGVAGQTTCTSGDDCASALCVEGHGGSLCSRGCAEAADCPTALPRCVSVALVGRFCARDPSAPPADGGAGPMLPGCFGDCAQTALAARFGETTRRLDRAQHGVDGPGRLHVEAHLGGDPACPNERSPTPRHTLIVRGLRAVGEGAAQTEAEGLSASLLDFTGELTTSPALRATAVRVMPRAYVAGQGVAFTLTATFASGTLTGSVFAPHCPSLDAR